mgnify:CR=1 FL=1
MMEILWLAFSLKAGRDYGPNRDGDSLLVVSARRFGVPWCCWKILC